jgi:hypothetical protein
MQILVSANNRSYCDIESVLYNKQKTELIKYPAGQKAISWIIPDGVTSIGEHAFNGCSSLTSITIPDGVTSIGEHAFFRCSSLTSITARINQETFSKLDAEHKVLVALGYLENIKSFDKEKFEHFSKYCKSQGKRIVLKIIEHDNIAAMYNFADFGGTSVKNYETIFAEAQKAKATQIVAFLLDYRNKNISTDALDKKEALELKRALTPPNPHSAAELKKLWSTKNLDDGTLEIRKYKGNDASASVPSQIGKKIVTSIGERAFYECSSLTGITVPDGVTSIGAYAFYECSSLASITIPDSVTSIGNYAFSWCSSLASVTIPDGVTSIGWNAFNGCSSLTSITIPDGVTSIGGIAFSGCSSLASITVEANNLSYCDIDGVLFDVKKKKLLDYPQGRKDTSYTIPASVTSIEHGAFSGCSSLTSIAIPDSVTSIGDNAFSGCSSLASVTIPDGVTSIWASTFSKCSSLTSITIPDSVTSIGYTSIGYAAFSGCSSLTIHAPAGSYAEKYAAENNIKFAAI